MDASQAEPPAMLLGLTWVKRYCYCHGIDEEVGSNELFHWLLNALCYLCCCCFPDLSVLFDGCLFVLFADPQICKVNSQCDDLRVKDYHELRGGHPDIGVEMRLVYRIAYHIQLDIFTTLHLTIKRNYFV